MDYYKTVFFGLLTQRDTKLLLYELNENAYY